MPSEILPEHPFSTTNHTGDSAAGSTAGSAAGSTADGDHARPLADPVTPGEVSLGAQRVGPATVIHVAGDIDARTCEVFDRYLMRHLRSRASHLVVDLSRLTFLGSAGLAVLRDAERVAATHGTRLGLVASTPAVTRPLEITGLDGSLIVHEDLAAATHEVQTA